ncbi:unnamed protein product [Amoebophrya sp. A25]|nr:unnamed protein product [Amoebophrya sp. A25]|eukprot:GSA25T00005330001.1
MLVRNRRLRWQPVAAKKIIMSTNSPENPWMEPNSCGTRTSIRGPCRVRRTTIRSDWCPSTAAALLLLGPLAGNISVVGVSGSVPDPIVDIWIPKARSDDTYPSQRAVGERYASLCPEVRTTLETVGTLVANKGQSVDWATDNDPQKIKELKDALKLFEGNFTRYVPFLRGEEWKSDKYVQVEHADDKKGVAVKPTLRKNDNNQLLGLSNADFVKYAEGKEQPSLATDDGRPLEKRAITFLDVAADALGNWLVDPTGAPSTWGLRTHEPDFEPEVADAPTSLVLGWKYYIDDTNGYKKSAVARLAYLLQQYSVDGLQRPDVLNCTQTTSTTSTTTTTPSAAVQEEEDEGLSTWAIVAIVVGSVAAALLLGCVVYSYCCRTQRGWGGASGYYGEAGTGYDAYGNYYQGGAQWTSPVPGGAPYYYGYGKGKGPESGYGGPAPMVPRKGKMGMGGKGTKAMGKPPAQLTSNPLLIGKAPAGSTVKMKYSTAKSLWSGKKGKKSMEETLGNVQQKGFHQVRA